jgi:hypothetical protein
MFAPDPQRSLLGTLLLGALVFGVCALGAVVLYGATGWLWLVVHVKARRFPPPWSIDELETCFVVIDSAGAKARVWAGAIVLWVFST